MPDNAVKARVNDLLALLDLDGPGQVSILPEHLGIQKVRSQKHTCSHPYGPIGHNAPAKAPVQSGDHESGDEKQPAQFHHGLLFLFLAMPLALASPVSFMIMLGYIPVIAKRIKNEEKVLEEGLAGYADYKEKVKYRILPFIW